MAELPSAGAFLDAQRVVSSLGISQGQQVADFGCGSGYFTMELAKAVGSGGIVNAVDVMEEPLQAVHAKAEAAGMKQVQIIRADLEVLGGTKLSDGSQDWVLLKNVLFQSQKKEAILAEAARVAKAGGRVVIIEWKKGAGGIGPPEALRSEESAVQQMAQASGLRTERPLSVDSSHFGFVFIK
ncbi:MAG: methyltransferase domain-containing protein [Patescibacteria group bacterium]